MARSRFSYTPQAEIPRAVFDRSHSHKMTIDERKLFPIYFDEALPGDTFKLRMTLFARLATPIKPVMDNLWIDTHYFAVPYRLLWDHWEEFNGAKEPGETTDYTTPKVIFDPNTWDEQTANLVDAFGLPVNAGNIFMVNAFHFRAYNLIFNEWFRDQNLQDSATVPTDDGVDPDNLYHLHPRNKRHDYFTSCLPWPQKGEAVNIPLGGLANVIPSGDHVPKFQVLQDPNTKLRLQGSATREVHTNVSNVGDDNDFQWYNPNLAADLTNASTVTINELREAFQLQKMLERDARGGTRYPEVIYAHFGVTNPDARLQRPEYLGGGSTRVAVKPVEQNTPALATDDTPQGNLAAYGTAVMPSNGFTRSFTEHCVIIGLISTRSSQSYQFGIDRSWSRDTRYDYYWPALSHIGEQAVLGKEIWYDGTAGDEEVFGYQERYAEYRYKQSLITGKFRSDDPQSLDIWHLGQDYANRPVLDNTFIQERPPIDRISAVPSEPAFLIDSYFDLKCARPMPLYGTPGNMDRF